MTADDVVRLLDTAPVSEVAPIFACPPYVFCEIATLMNSFSLSFLQYSYSGKLFDMILSVCLCFTFLTVHRRTS
jgi:hypothetical protein